MSLYCEHERLSDACEDCAYERAQEAGMPLGGPHPSVVRERNEQAHVGAMVVGPTADGGGDQQGELVTNEQSVQQPDEVAQQTPAKAARTTRDRRPAGEDVTP